MIAYSLIPSQLFTLTTTFYISKEGKGEKWSTSETANQSS